METVPSAIATASIVGAGSVGLVFAQLDHTKTPGSSAGEKRLSKYDPEVTDLSPLPRPATSAAAGHSDSLPISRPELPTSESRYSTTSKRNSGFYSHIFPRRRKGSEAPAFVGESEEERRESGSSRGSWIKRLSTIENSQISSPRSSIAPNSPSFSHTSAAPILSTTGSPVQLPPNKLVKRTSKLIANGSPISKTEPGYSHSLRRPATSHQRSATLQQQFRVDEARYPSSPLSPLSPLSPTSPQTIQFEFLQSRLHHHWTQFFVPRTTRQSRDRSPRDRSRVDGSLQSSYTTTKRILPDSMTPASLITANMITPNRTVNSMVEDNSHMHELSAAIMHSSTENSPGQLDSTTTSSQRKPRRTLSKHFSPPPSWTLRAGSTGRRKDKTMESSEGDRNASVSGTTSPHIPQHLIIAEQHIFQKHLSRDDGDIKVSSNTLSRSARKRNTSSPLPPLARISSFTLDLAHIGSPSSSPSSTPLRTPEMHESKIIPMQYPVTNQSAESGSSPPVSATTHSKSNCAPEVARSDCTSTLVGSDNEIRGFYSGDDEDTDFRSDTIFDSFRTGTTGTTGSLRVQNPLETMFDASPSSSASKNNMDSLCDDTLRGPFLDDSDNISGEDESTARPVEEEQAFENDFAIPMNLEMQTSSGPANHSSPPALPLVNEDFGRLSLEDDDEDEDWAREAEEFGVRNSLSPPSSSLNSRRVSPTLRAALADMTNDNPTANSSRNTTIRPYSNLFEWSDSHSEKKQHVEVSERPKTEHGMQGMQGMDSTGVRRRAPTLLLRTQSVPVVPDDIVGHAKVVPKGPKKNEDWGDDFFEHCDEGPDSGIAILVPPAIQATQASVMGHARLMQDVLPVLNELKRLRTIAQEKDLLNGPYAPLWKEADGIIALAFPPIEEAVQTPLGNEEVVSPPVSPTSVDFDHDTIDDRYRDCGFDGEVLDSPDEVSDEKSVGLSSFNSFGSLGSFGQVSDTATVRRRSVFLPGDDIFGHSADTVVDVEAPKPSPDLNQFSENTINVKPSKPATFPRIHGKDPAAIARSVMETMHQYRSISDPLHTDHAMKSPNRMPFDTTSLRDFVNRANNLIKTLAEVIRASDCASQTPPTCSPQRTESPAFTRVFTDPLASPPRRLPRTKSTTSNLGGSTDSSPTKSHGKRIHVMTVM